MIVTGLATARLTARMPYLTGAERSRDENGNYLHESDHFQSAPAAPGAIELEFLIDTGAIFSVLPVR